MARIHVPLKIRLHTLGSAWPWRRGTCFLNFDRELCLLPAFQPSIDANTRLLMLITPKSFLASGHAVVADVVDCYLLAMVMPNMLIFVRFRISKSISVVWCKRQYGTKPYGCLHLCGSGIREKRSSNADTRKTTLQELQSKVLKPISDALGTRLISTYLVRIHLGSHFCSPSDPWEIHSPPNITGSVDASRSGAAHGVIQDSFAFSSISNENGFAHLC